MKVNTVQAAEILGITKGRVHTLIEKGHLKDHKVRNPEAQKHYPSLDSKEVREFAKTEEWKKLRGQTRYTPPSNGHHTNGHTAQPGTGVFTLLREHLGLLRQLSEKIEVMNDKIDHLGKLWS